MGCTCRVLRRPCDVKTRCRGAARRVRSTFHLRFPPSGSLYPEYRRNVILYHHVRERPNSTILCGVRYHMGREHGFLRVLPSRSESVARIPGQIHRRRCKNNSDDVCGKRMINECLEDVRRNQIRILAAAAAVMRKRQRTRIPEMCQ